MCLIFVEKVKENALLWNSVLIMTWGNYYWFCFEAEFGVEIEI
jgi:hypothetical protein